MFSVQSARFSRDGNGNYSGNEENVHLNMKNGDQKILNYWSSESKPNRSDLSFHQKKSFVPILKNSTVSRYNSSFCSDESVSMKIFLDGNAEFNKGSLLNHLNSTSA